MNKADNNGHDSFGPGTPDEDGKYPSGPNGITGFVGGWDYDSNSGTAVRGSHSDPRGNGGPIGHQSRHDDATKSQASRIADTASLMGRTHHPEFAVKSAISTPYGTWGVDTNKCNCFVAVVLGMENATVPNVVSVFGVTVGVPAAISVTGIGHAPTAADWSDASVPGYSPVGVGGYQRGDVVGAKADFSDATGHAGVVTGVDSAGNITEAAYAGQHGTQIGTFGSPGYMSNPENSQFSEYGGSRPK